MSVSSAGSASPRTLRAGKVQAFMAGFEEIMVRIGYEYIPPCFPTQGNERDVSQGEIEEFRCVCVDEWQGYHHFDAFSLLYIFRNVVRDCTAGDLAL